MPGLRAAMTGSAVAAVTATMLAGCGGSGASGGTTASGPVDERPRGGVVEDCSTHSEATFPGAFSDSRNVVVGPLVLVGAAYTPASTVREFGGNKFPALVRAGHRVTIALSPRLRHVASLGYGPLPEGVELSPRDGHAVVTFVSCRAGERSGSTADGRSVTFWSGSVLVRSPRCVPIDVWVDDESSPRHVALRVGVGPCGRT